MQNRGLANPCFVRRENGEMEAGGTIDAPATTRSGDNSMTKFSLVQKSATAPRRRFTSWPPAQSSVQSRATRTGKRSVEAFWHGPYATEPTPKPAAKAAASRAKIIRLSFERPAANNRRPFCVPKAMSMGSGLSAMIRCGAGLAVGTGRRTRNPFSIGHPEEFPGGRLRNGNRRSVPELHDCDSRH